MILPNKNPASFAELDRVQTASKSVSLEVKDNTPSNQAPICPPTNILHVNRWSELPYCIEPAKYRVQNDDGFTDFTVTKKTRQVLEGLIKQPVACASKCRISDRVLLLRRDCGLDIEMKMFKGDGVSEGENFGVYFLNSDIARLEESEAK